MRKAPGRGIGAALCSGGWKASLFQRTCWLRSRSDTQGDEMAPQADTVATGKGGPQGGSWRFTPGAISYEIICGLVESGLKNTTTLQMAPLPSTASPLIGRMRRPPLLRKHSGSSSAPWATGGRRKTTVSTAIGCGRSPTPGIPRGSCASWPSQLTRTSC